MEWSCFVAFPNFCNGSTPTAAIVKSPGAVLGRDEYTLVLVLSRQRFYFVFVFFCQWWAVLGRTLGLRITYHEPLTSNLPSLSLSLLIHEIGVGCSEL
jgi:hypothetical protein